MYRGDTFFHLSAVGQAGLVLISGAIATLVIWLVWRLSRRTHWPTRVLVGLGGFVLFDWLVPQVHYLWYMVVIDGLPLQWVIGPWPYPFAAVDVMFLQSGASLSAHSRAVLAWITVAVALFGGCFLPPPTHL